MNYVGDYTAGDMVYIYFNTFDSNDPSASVTMTNFVNTDVHIHKGSDLTQRNNAAGVTVDVDVDGIAGCHLISIDTSDNTVADFFVSGADYGVRIEGVTVDAATLNPFVGHFSIENRHVAGSLVRTTIATLASQTSFTLTAGSAEDDAYNNCTIIVTDIASAVQKAIGRISDYTGATKTVTLAADPGIFTMAASDRVHIIAASALANVDAYQGVLAVAGAIPAAAADAAGGLPISDGGGLALDTQLANTHEVTAARMGALTDWIDAGRLDAILDIIAGDVVNLDGDAMRGTDNAALASVLGALADVAAAGDPTSADTVMQYLKQLINTIEGAVGIPAYPASADPANNVSLAEAIRAIRDDVTAIAGDAMRGTDSAATAASLTTHDTDIKALLPAALVSGRMDSDVGAMQAGVITAAVIADAAIDDATLAADMDRYQAIVTMALDSAGATNRYGVDFALNGEPVDTGITVPKIQIIKCSDGTDLVALVALVEVGSLGRYQYVESTNTITAGQLYKVYVEATIGGSSRTWHYHMWRDA